MTNAEIFRKAADYIREHGWHQGDAGYHGGPRCAHGAITSVMTGRDHPGDLSHDVIEMDLVACERLGGTGRIDALFHWNDQPERTADEVIALLDGLAFDEDLKAAASSPAPGNKPEPIASPTLLKEAVTVG